MRGFRPHQRLALFDIEGAEFDLLRDGKSDLAGCVLMVMELHPDAYMDRGASVTELLARLDDCGFEVIRTDGTVIVARYKAA